MKAHTGKQLKHLRWPLFCLFALAVTLIAGSDFTQRFKFFYAVENSSLDLRFALRGSEDPAQDAESIVIIKIDDRSLYPNLSEEDLRENPDAKYLTEPWPWNRAAHAKLSERLINAGAKVVVFDLVFPSPNSGDFDFLDVIEAHPGKIILGFDYVIDESAMGEVFVEERPPYDDLLPVDYESMLGFVNVRRDEDGALRRAKLTTNIFNERSAFTKDKETYDRLIKAASMAEPQYGLGVRAALSVKPELKKELPSMQTYPLINYGSANHFKTISYLDILLEDRYAKQANLINNSIVFVGGYSDFFKDVITGPFGDMAGVESHANVARSLLNDSFYKETASSERWLILCLITLFLLVGTLYFKGPIGKGAFIFGLLAFYLLAALGAFIYLNYILPIVPALWVILLPGSLFLLYDYTIAQHERSRLQGYLGRYVSPEVAKVIAEDSSQLDALLRGANRPIVALFADIRDFTSLSEAMNPERLVEQLNEYFEVMVTIIHKRKGSLNKYIGDAILAVWGGIHSEGSKTDCENAILAALEMGEALEKLNEDWAKRSDREELAIGVGLSFGEGFVGNMGHSHRMEFAVMGDVVNLASRLEGATKLYDGYILINNALRKTCPDAFHFQEVDRLRVKGKALSIPVHRPVAIHSDACPDWLQDWNEARALYLKRDFAGAEKVFRALAEKYPGQKANAALYLERCHFYQENPPPEGWDGTYVMTSK